MTPQLQQAIKLLQLSRLELLDTISQELQSNPLLEEGHDEPPEPGPPAEEDHTASPGEPVSEVTIDEKPKEEIDWEEYLGD